MMMAAHDALDVVEAAQHGRHRRAVATVDAVHVAEAGAEGRMMHEDHRRLPAPLTEVGLEPGEPRRAHLAMAVARHHRVEADQPHVVAFDRVMQEAVVVW